MPRATRMLLSTIDACYGDRQFAVPRHLMSPGRRVLSRRRRNLVPARGAISIAYDHRTSIAVNQRAMGMLRLEDRLLGRFRIDAKVAEGGMGVVYRGFDLDFDQTIAIKVL